MNLSETEQETTYQVGLLDLKDATVLHALKTAVEVAIGMQILPRCQTSLNFAIQTLGLI
jgi:hypothetical protein